MHLKLTAFIGLLLLEACHNLPQKTVRIAWAGGRHTVRRGDTVYKIAKLRDVETFEIMEANGVSDASELKIGQVLYIPERSDKLRALIPPRKNKSKKPENSKSNLADSRSINLLWPVAAGVLLKSFSTASNRLHEGIAIGAPAKTPVFAAQDGEVIYLGDDGTNYGRLVIIRHADPFVTIYAHLDEILVNKGQILKKSDPIGTVGMTGGAVDSPRVYFQVRKDRTPVDPELYLKQ